MSIPPLARSAAATKSGRMISLTVNGDTRRTAASTIADNNSKNEEDEKCEEQTTHTLEARDAIKPTSDGTVS